MAKWEMNCKDKDMVKNGVQDLEKAQWYLNKLIEVKKGEKSSPDLFSSFGIELSDGC